jgi:metal-responsive CopG/Arc/MetJ family transcriptional regulator
MAKISIYLDEQRLKELDELVDNYPHLTKRSRLVKYIGQLEENYFGEVKSILK